MTAGYKIQEETLFAAEIRVSCRELDSVAISAIVGDQ